MSLLNCAVLIMQNDLKLLLQVCCVSVFWKAVLVLRSSISVEL